jgi:SpoVK/Ycf46/Vps4 family AAA+-type ATPase
MRAAFRSAQRDGKYGKPSFLMLDEIDTMCPARVISSESTSHGSRLVAQLLTLMDCGLSSESRNNQTNSFPLVLATTNRPDVLDTALRRPGRFDIEIEIKLPCVVQREHILNQYSQKLLMGCDVRLKTIAGQTQSYRPTEVEQLLGDPTKAKKMLNWEATTKFSDLVAEMVLADIALVEAGNLVA